MSGPGQPWMLIQSWSFHGLLAERMLAMPLSFSMIWLVGLLPHRVQLRTDGHRVYLEAVEGAFGADVDYAMLIKLYGEAPEQEKRYSPAQCSSLSPCAPRSPLNSRGR